MAAGGVDIATLGLEIDSRGFVRATREADKSLDKLAKTEGRVQKRTKSLQGALSGTMRVLGALGVTVGAGAIIRGLVNINREFQRLQAQLHTVEGSAAGATAAFSRIEELAVNTPFQIEGLTEAFVQLRVRGAQPTNEEFIALGDIASAFTRDITEVSSAVASATAGMTRPLRNLGFEASTAGDQITLAFGDAETTVQRDAQSIITAMMELTSGQVSGAMEREMNTINGVISNLFDNVGKLARAIGAGGGLNESISGNLAMVRDWIGDLAEARGEIAFFVKVALDGATALLSPFKNFTRVLFNVGQQVGEVANIIGAVLARDFERAGEIAERIEGNWRDMGDAVDDNKEAWSTFLDTVTNGDKIMADAAGAGANLGDAAGDMGNDLRDAGEEAERTTEELERLLSVLEDLSAVDVGTFGLGGGLAIPGGGGMAGLSRSTDMLRGPTTHAGIERHPILGARGGAAFDITDVLGISDLPDITPQFVGLRTEIAATGEAVDATAQAASNSLPSLDATVRGIVSLAGAFGDLDRGTEDALRGMSDVVSGFATVGAEGASTADQIAGGAGLVGGIVSLGAAFLGAGESADQLRRKVRAAAEEFDLALAEFAGTATETQRLIAQAADLGQDLFEPIEGIGIRAGISFAEALREGMALEDIVDVDTLDFGRFLQQTGQTAEEVFAELEADWNALNDTLAGRMLETGGVFEGLGDWAAFLTDQATAAGQAVREQAEATQQATEAAKENARTQMELFQQQADFINSLTFRELALSGSEGAADELRQELRFAEERNRAQELLEKGIIDEKQFQRLIEIQKREEQALEEKLAENTDATKEATEAARRTGGVAGGGSVVSQITGIRATQAARMSDILTSINVHTRETAINTRPIRGGADVPLGQVGARAPSGGAAVQVFVTIQGSASRRDAREIGREVADQVDSQIGRKLERERRRSGDARL